jgi:type IX secretion system PorP/SprF family membrane protein
MIAFISAFATAKAQQYPYFSQYIINPSLYNPATIGNSGRAELNLTYRQQWTGINDAPLTQAFNFQYPTRNNLYFGINFYHDRTVLLNTSAIMAGVAYRVVLADEHSLKFGLSTGFGMNNFSLSEVEHLDDPAIYDALENTNFMAGQFGVYYKFHKLSLAFSLPQLYSYRAVDSEKIQSVRITQFDSYLLSADYQFSFSSSNLGLRPFIIYRHNRNLPEIVEVGGFADYKDFLWLGAGYRTNYSLTTHFGITIKKDISFTYAYEFASSRPDRLGNGSHEINFKLRLGKNKHTAPSVSRSLKTPIKPLKQTKAKEISSNEKIAETNKNEGADAKQINANINNSSIINGSNSLNPASSKEETENEEVYLSLEDVGVVQQRSQHSNEKSHGSSVAKSANYPNIGKHPGFIPGFYVVLGAFEYYDNAIMYMRQLNGRGIHAQYGYLGDKRLYYVYTAREDVKDSADTLKRKFSEMEGFSDVWIFEVE